MGACSYLAVKARQVNELSDFRDDLMRHYNYELEWLEGNLDGTGRFTTVSSRCERPAKWPPSST